MGIKREKKKKKFLGAISSRQGFKEYRMCFFLTQRRDYTPYRLSFFFINCITIPTKDSAFENTLLRSLSWFLHSYLGLKPERRRRKKFFFQVEGKSLFSTKSGLGLFCTISAKEAAFENSVLLLNRANKVCTQELGCVCCFHRGTIPISSPSLHSPRAPEHHSRWQKGERIISSPLRGAITSTAKFLIK